MSLPLFSPAEFMSFVLILIRVSIILFLVPIFGSILIPAQIKIALALVLSLVLSTTLKVEVGAFPTEVIGFVPLVLGEVVMGLALSLLIRTIFAGVQIAGQYIGYQMGFAVANVMDPQTGEQVSILAEFSYLLALVVFLAVNGHYIIIKGLAESFNLVPPGRLSLSPVVFDQISGAAAQMFVIGVKIGAPAMAVLFFIKVSMGIVAKSVPQMNVLFVGLPLYILVGLFIFGLSLNFFVPVLARFFRETDLAVLTLLRSL